MSSEISLPFSLTPSGAVATIDVPNDQTQQHLQVLVSTQPGERVMQPGYGVPLASQVFGLDNNQLAGVVSRLITSAVQKWEPSVNIQDVRPTIDDTSLGILAINVDYAPGPLASPVPNKVQTATVLVGGTVVTT